MLSALHLLGRIHESLAAPLEPYLLPPYSPPCPSSRVTPPSQSSQATSHEDSLHTATPLPTPRPKRKASIFPPTPAPSPKRSKYFPPEPTEKIHLIQEQVRDDPWKLLIATSLLNVTSGRAARPIFWEILRRYPTPSDLSRANIPELSLLLYPLGLSNKRALSLAKFSTQYLELGWPDLDAERLDVRIFHGAGVYASDSFRIYSSLLSGGGGPRDEEKWMERGSPEYEEIMLEDAREDEWRRVIPKDKELRRYLEWRWALEGIHYDIDTGPQIVRAQDRKRLGLD